MTTPPLATTFEFDPEFLGRLVGSFPSAASFRSEISREDEMFLKPLAGYGGNHERACVRYLTVGKQMMDEVRQLVQWAFGGWQQVESVLDFASGYGRFTRHLIQEVEPQRVWVSDIYEDAVHFQRELFGVGGLPSMSDPGEFTSPRRFDLIFVSSLFSHLPSHRFLPWLSKLYSLLSDRGLLVFTTHGIDLVQDAADDFVFRPISESRSLEGSEYGSTFVSDAFVSGAIREATGDSVSWKGFAHGYLGFQDLYALSRDAGRRFESLRYDPGIFGHVDFCKRTGDQIGLNGWAADPGELSPLRVRVLAGSKCLAECVPSIERPDIVKLYGSDALARTGWWCSFPDGAIHATEWIQVEVARGDDLHEVISLDRLDAMLSW